MKLIIKRWVFSTDSHIYIADNDEPSGGFSGHMSFDNEATLNYISVDHHFECWLSICLNI